MLVPVHDTPFTFVFLRTRHRGTDWFCTGNISVLSASVASVCLPSNSVNGEVYML